VQDWILCNYACVTKKYNTVLVQILYCEKQHEQ
jgi:hypothetical protein